MRSHWCWSLVLAGGLGVSTISLAGEGKEPHITWVSSLPAALQQAQREQKLVLVDVYTDWCGPCKLLDQRTFTDETVIKLSQQFVCLKVNGDQEREFVRQYRIRAYPTTLFLTGQGEVVHRAVGYRPPKSFLAVMKQAQQNAREYRQAQTRLQTHPDDLEANFLLARFYLRLGKFGKAQPLMEKVEKLDPQDEKGFAPELLAVKAQALLEEGDYKTAQPLVDEVLKRDPENKGKHHVPLLMALGVAYGQSEQFDEALTCFQRVIKDYPQSEKVPLARLYLGYTYLRAERNEEARATLEALAKDEQAPAEVRKQAQGLLNRLREGQQNQ
ncbi:MAG TPA: tetratricopeptide repeat protein [Armatimonadetes bacterium]|nr:tetratricopeptide repeat protein [Armatimonadota bacterium]